MGYFASWPQVYDRIQWRRPGLMHLPMTEKCPGAETPSFVPKMAEIKSVFESGRRNCLLLDSACRGRSSDRTFSSPVNARPHHILPEPSAQRSALGDRGVIVQVILSSAYFLYENTRCPSPWVLAPLQYPIFCGSHAEDYSTVQHAHCWHVRLLPSWMSGLTRALAPVITRLDQEQSSYGL
jgi:hypothetical protein